MKISLSIFTPHFFLLFLFLLTFEAASKDFEEKRECDGNWVLDTWPSIASRQCSDRPTSSTVLNDSKNLILISIWEYCGTTALAVYNKCFDIVYFLTSLLIAIFQSVYVFVQALVSNPIVISGIAYFKQLKTLMWPTINGLAVVIFSWIIMYFDSKIPGVYPPSPISPRKHRVRSGHTFHLGYTVGLLNGMMAFSMTLWQQLIE